MLSRRAANGMLPNMKSRFPERTVYWGFLMVTVWFPGSHLGVPEKV